MLTVAALLAAVAGGVSARPAVPVGIRYDTPLEKGAWSLSYTYARESGKGVRDGTHRIEADEATSGRFTNVSERLESDVHTFDLRHAPFERMTIALMLPFVERKMRNRDFDAGGDRYTTRSSGLGDLELVSMIPFMKKGEETLDFYAGLFLPTGEISERDDVPGGAGEEKVLLPLSMQTGSRSTALLVGLTYQGYRRWLGWGFHAAGILGVERNHRHYRQGDRVSLSGWLAHDVTDWLSGSLRLGFDQRMRYKGKDVVGQENHVSSRRNTTGGKWLELSPGLSVGLPWGGEQKLSLEATWPVYQKTEGPQVERDWTLTTGWEWIF